MRPNSQFRYRAGVLHVLDKAARTDIVIYLNLMIILHSLDIKVEKLVKQELTLAQNDDYQADEQAIARILSEMVKEEQLIRELDRELLYYKPSFLYSEQHLAKLLQQKLETNLDVDRKS